MKIEKDDLEKFLGRYTFYSSVWKDQHQVEIKNFIQDLMEWVKKQEQRIRADERSKMMDEICNECTQLQHCSQWPWQQCYGNQLAAAQAKIECLDRIIDAITDISVYPMSVKGGENSYDKRTPYMEGWNACNREMLGRYYEICKETGEDAK